MATLTEQIHHLQALQAEIDALQADLETWEEIGLPCRYRADGHTITVTDAWDASTAPHMRTVGNRTYLHRPSIQWAYMPDLEGVD